LWRAHVAQPRVCGLREREQVDQDLKILVIDGVSADPAGNERRLKEMGYARTRTIGPDKSLLEIESLSPDVTIVGSSLSPEQRYESIRKLKIVDILAPVLVLPGPDTPQEEDLPAGFHGIFSFSPDADRLEISTRIEESLKSRSDCAVLPDLPVLVGRTPKIHTIRDRIHRVSDKDVTVLIEGETGTGKEIVAHCIHYFSLRRKGPLIKISCGNLPDQLLESEVFGYQKGAFTDARRNKPGRLELADNGTLFLDEVGDLSLFLQVKFLQIFEDRAFSRLGAVDEQVIDARVVAATNFDLAKKVKEGEFRRDLFYRLNVVHIRTPPLRERKEDIPLLAEYFLRRYCSLIKKEPVELPAETLERFHSYRWPGNVRELENMVKRAIVLRSWDFVEQEMLSGEKGAAARNGSPSPDSGCTPDLGGLTRHLGEENPSLREITRAYVSEIERKAILDALDVVRWNRKRAAGLLGISYKTVCNRIKDLGIRAV